ncbi:MAG: pseudouridylate synthase [Kiritimatiellaceae bacterium]|nr:pseudouridylate synthase [Kiritimatiellaceae bacterium]|tara:strand:+ start:3089 stop:3820 length:732 start_codon:yes stop_codon:yes gene_type:complete
MEVERLSKIMAARGLCSRREADRFIERGLVRVDGVVVDRLGTKVSPEAEIVLSEGAAAEQAELATFLLNKPIGYVSGQPEEGYKAAVSLIKGTSQWRADRSARTFSGDQLRGVAPAGRLDIDSNGLLVLTQDGRVARTLIGEETSVEKEYLVRVRGELDERGLTRLNHGLQLDGKALKPAKVKWQNRDQLRFVLREGKKRQIRRMCELVGLKVVGLKRIRIGKVVLGNLPEGQWRYLDTLEQF